MGYRLEVSELDYKFCGGKLYGYIEEENLKELESYKWLLKHGYIDGTEYWDYGCNPQIVLFDYEFRQFMELYKKDWEKIKGTSFLGSENGKKKFEELLKSNKSKILEWG